jgi:hypothetical protein
MKTLATILFIAVFTLLVLLYFANRQNQENARRDRKTLLQKIELLQNQRDSLNRLANQYRDSSDVYLASMIQARLAARLLNQEVITLRKRQQAIKFIRTNTDAERDSILKSLYPSLK